MMNDAVLFRNGGKLLQPGACDRNLVSCRWPFGPGLTCRVTGGTRWCSILVRSFVSQEGPKNPLKGISEKPLVSAANAQFGVGAGGRRSPTSASSGRFPMAWKTRPC